MAYNIQPISLEQTIAALRGGGDRTANAIEAGQAGVAQSQAAELEKRKAALAQRIQEAGLVKGSELGLANVEPQRELTPAVAELFVKQNQPKKTQPMLSQEDLKAEIDEANSVRRRMGLPPMNGQAILNSPDAMTQDKALNRMRRDLQRESQLYATLTGPERQVQADVSKNFDLYQDINSALESVTRLYSPDYVGPVGLGSLSQAGQRVGVNSTPEKGEFYAGLDAFRNAIMKARSGGAVTDGEASRVLGELPDKNTGAVDFEARLGRAIKLWGTILAEKKRLSKGMLNDDILAPVSWTAPVRNQPAPQTSQQSSRLEQIRAEKARRAAQGGK